MELFKGTIFPDTITDKYRRLNRLKHFNRIPDSVYEPAMRKVIGLYAQDSCDEMSEKADIDYANVKGYTDLYLWASDSFATANIDVKENRNDAVTIGISIDNELLSAIKTEVKEFYDDDDSEDACHDKDIIMNSEVNDDNVIELSIDVSINNLIEISYDAVSIDDEDLLDESIIIEVANTVFLNECIALYYYVILEPTIKECKAFVSFIYDNMLKEEYPESLIRQFAVNICTESIEFSEWFMDNMHVCIHSVKELIAKIPTDKITVYEYILIENYKEYTMDTQEYSDMLSGLSKMEEYFKFNNVSEPDLIYIMYHLYIYIMIATRGCEECL